MWKTLITHQRTVDKLLEAEIRLKAPIGNLLKRWVIDEQLPVNNIHTKLDVGTNTVNKLITLYGLDDQKKHNHIVRTRRLRVTDFSDTLNLNEDDWPKILAPKVVSKIRASEERLKDTLPRLMNRWVYKDKITINYIALRLDVGLLAVETLINFFKLRAKIDENRREVGYGRSSYKKAK